MNLVVTNENMNRVSHLADSFGTALHKHAEWRKPSLTKTAQPHSAPGPDLGSLESLLTPPTAQRTTLADVRQRCREESEMVRATQRAVMHRSNFAIDAIGDSDSEEEEDDTGVIDEVRFDDRLLRKVELMWEVEAFLKAHGEDGEGLNGEQKKVATGGRNGF
ncbi:hypothetical protein EHS25_007201 [Saitozyma podzolica]|uniref:Uncharacterized protein n=1 Tax=Saitozyma podzolica TaxID=1890683 RepID=A0A427XMR0_9TREE|nr:hypothetical protein EHS25_007201 [Saitozyma podzolica]